MKSHPEWCEINADLPDLPLQKSVQDNVGVGQIIIKISDRALHAVGNVLYIDVRNRRQNCPIDLVREIIKLAIRFFVRIDRIDGRVGRMRGSATRK